MDKQLEPSPTINPDRPGISLALGGGGGKGIVHIGVLKAIEQHQLRIEAIVGTSVGAIWGALFAVTADIKGKGQIDAQQNAIEILEQIAYQFRFPEFLDLYIKSLFTKGVVKGDKFENWLQTMLWDLSANPQRVLTFRDLDLDLAITVTDALTGDTIICNKLKTPNLPIAKAVRASMSVQGFFREVTMDIPQSDGRLKAVRCWDGGTTGNCRFDLAYRMNPNRPIIASSLTYRGEAVEVEKGFLRVLWRGRRIRDHSINILLRQIESLLLENIEEADSRILLIRPPLLGISTFDFSIPNDRKQKAITSACEHAFGEIVKFRERTGRL